MRLKMTSRSRTGVLKGITVALSVMLISLLSPGALAADPPDTVIELPAGLACDFDLRIEIRGGEQVFREFTDHNGNVVRTLSAGRGFALSFTNLASGATYSLKANGAVTHTRFNEDGSSTVVLTGHHVLILFPTDVPAGPSTTLHVGRVVYTVDQDGIFTVQKVSGKTTDICARLSE